MFFCFYFICFFIYFRLFALGFAHLGLDMPRAGIIVILSLITVLAVNFVPYLFFKKNPVLDFLKSAYQKIGKGTMILGAAFAGLCGPHIAVLGLGDIKLGGIAGFFAAVGGICVSFVFFILLFLSIYGIRDKIRSFFAVFCDLKFVVLVLGVNLAAVLYLVFSKQVYFWDNAGYWESAAGMSKIIFAEPERFFKELVDSIFESDYNQIPAALPALAMAVFGSNRLAFVLSVLNFYFVPVLAFMYMVSKNFTGFIIVILCLPMCFYLSVLGFLDVGGVFLGLLVLYIFLCRKPEPGADFLGGVALCLLILFRRWYIFFAAGFIFCAVLYTLILRGDKIKKFAFTFFGFLSSFFIFFQGYLTKRLLGQDYADIYSAYKFSFDADVKIFLRYFGILLVLSVSGYLIYAIIARKKEKLINTVFLYVFFAATFFLFTLIQTHGQQHLLLYVPALALLLINMAQNSKRSKMVLAAVSVLCSAGMFLPGAQPQSLGEIASFAPLPSFSIYPVVREDADALLELAEYVKNLEGDVAVLASSFVINADILAKTEASLNFLVPLERSKNIAYLPEVDKRDGKPYNIVYVSYIVTAAPIQTHLDPKDQLAVVVPAQMLLSDTPFSSAFEKSDMTFALKDGVKVYIYKRLRPNTEEEMEELWEAMDFSILYRSVDRYSP